MKAQIEARSSADQVSLIFVKIETGNTPNIPFYLADPAKLGADFKEALAG
jgi:hypothetical protein